MTASDCMVTVAVAASVVAVFTSDVSLQDRRGSSGSSWQQWHQFAGTEEAAVTEVDNSVINLQGQKRQ